MFGGQEGKTRTRQQVPDSFKIDLHVGDFHHILQVRVRLDNRLEDLLCDSGNQALQVWGVNIRALKHETYS